MERRPSRNSERSERSERLDRAAVVQAAAALADRFGDMNQVTLAQLADHFGVRVPSLYNHIEGLKAVRREVALLGIRDLAAQIRQAAIGKAGDDAIVSIAHAYRKFAIRALRSVAHGFVSLELAGGFGLPLDRDESFARLVQMFLDGLNSEHRPLISGKGVHRNLDSDAAPTYASKHARRA